jgi:hypothetical protein
MRALLGWLQAATETQVGDPRTCLRTFVPEYQPQGIAAGIVAVAVDPMSVDQIHGDRSVVSAETPATSAS